MYHKMVKLKELKMSRMMTSESRLKGKTKTAAEDYRGRLLKDREGSFGGKNIPLPLSTSIVAPSLSSTHVSVQVSVLVSILGQE